MGLLFLVWGRFDSLRGEERFFGKVFSKLGFEFY